VLRSWISEGRFFITGDQGKLTKLDVKSYQAEEEDKKGN
jgi:hypothetical protein